MNSLVDGMTGAASPVHEQHHGLTSARLESGLTRLALGSAALALLLVGCLLNGVNFWQGRNELLAAVRVEAESVAALAAPALHSGDRRALATVLNNVQGSKRVLHATVLDSRQQIIAESAIKTTDTAAAPRSYRVEVPVTEGSSTLGTLRIEVASGPLFQRVTTFALITLLAITFALVLSYFLAVGVRRRIVQVEQQLFDLAYMDSVTGLFNRHAAGKHLQDYVRMARHSGEGFAVVTLDLDNFKTINDTLGHHIGDVVLRTIAERMQSVLQPGARAYRFGGDEFVIICPDIKGFHDPRCYGLLARHALTGSAHIQGFEINLSGSIGVARFPHDGTDADEVVRASDMAMYAAKSQSKNGMVIFDSGMRQASEQRIAIESELRHALRNGELRLHYQPVVTVQGGALVGVEALVRWLHPQRGLLHPGAFIDVAESSGLVVELGGWALAEAARQIVRWDAEGMQPVQVAVNVSARQLVAGVLVQQYRDAVAASGCDPSRLEIELTEHSLVENFEQSMLMLSELRDLGVHIAIDDFGTGLSSLSYLKRVPIDKLKIDRSFIRDLPHDRGDVVIVGAALSMARSLGLRVVAEGIETDMQLQALRRMGCEFAQGYLFSKPHEAEFIAAWARLRGDAQSHGDRAVGLGLTDTG